MNKVEFQRALGVGVDGIIGPASVSAFEASVTNRSAPALTQADYADAAAKAKVDVPRVRMVRAVESGPFGSFDQLGRPTILFERHKFHAFTGGAFSARFPEISNRKAGGYSKGGVPHHEWQWTKLRAALRIDPEAAIMSCSWGLFQVMGFHWKVLGYESALDMTQRMAVSEAAQLDAMVRYVVVNRLDDELRACKPGDPASCVPFAAGYNGSGFRLYGYHRKLAEALAGFSR